MSQSWRPRLVALCPGDAVNPSMEALRRHPVGDAPGRSTTSRGVVDCGARASLVACRVASMRGGPGFDIARMAGSYGWGGASAWWIARIAGHHGGGGWRG